MYRKTFAEINLDHLAYNFELLKRSFPQTPFLCPMVKANAYGHGDIAVARCLEQLGAKHLGVCLIEEGLLLRRGGVKAEVLVFRGFDQEGALQMIRHNLTPVVSTWDQFDAIESVAVKSVQIHLKFNTGMNRLGFPSHDAQALFERCWQNPRIRVQGLLTHLYNGDDAHDPNGQSAGQLAEISKVVQVFKPLAPVVHSLNSSGILNTLLVREQNNSRHPLTEVQWGLRPGLIIYGYNPLADQNILPLKPVMSLKSVTSTYRNLKVGEVVSYGGTWTAPKDAVIAVVPIGYADGYHRILSNKASVLFGKHRAPIIGNICMDFLMVDVTAAVGGKNASELGEQEIVFFGEGTDGQILSASELAQKAQTIPWEILTSVGERVPRIYVGEWAKKLGVAS